MRTDVAHAYTRFGWGRAASDPTPADPRAWLAAQLDTPDPGPPGPSLADAFAAAEADRQDRKDPATTDRAHRARDLFRAETAALQDTAVATPTPFRERLVWFWANHFTVSTKQNDVVPLVGDYVRTAIRPHVAGPFHAMLRAAMRHPAMLLYLDNARSIGPASPAARHNDRRSGKGFNENLARECLELHTLGATAGYTQDDVAAMAALLTGWSVAREEGAFRFRPNQHQPGPKTLLGHTFPDGEAGGEAALHFLATHPATYARLATKLVRHFVADTPPPEAVRRVVAMLADTGGDLREAALAVIQLPDAWTPGTKLRTPQDLVLATLRSAGLPTDRRPPVDNILAGLGQPMFAAPFPTGWPDTAADWAGPEAVMRRIDWIYGFAGRPELPEPAAWADTALGPLLAPATADAMRRAGSRREAITLLLASPEFQRR